MIWSHLKEFPVQLRFRIDVQFVNAVIEIAFYIWINNSQFNQIVFLIICGILNRSDECALPSNSIIRILKFLLDF